MTAPFQVGDIVETVKGAKFWGRVASTYSIEKEYVFVGSKVTETVPGPTDWRCDVFAIHPEFFGTIHVYPATQLRLRALATHGDSK